MAVLLAARHGTQLNSGYRPSRLVIQWHLSDRCNLRCTHCYQPSYRGGEEGLAQWLPRLEAFRAFLRPVGQQPAIPSRLTLTGGEPFALDQFPEFLEIVAGLRDEFTFAILTNGTLIDAALARRLRDWSPAYVQVSIDGSAATHDAIRGEGNFVRAVSGIRALVAAGIHTVISFTALRSNRHEFPLVARLGRELGVARVWSDRLIPEGQGGRDEVMSPAETRDYIDLLASAKSQIEVGSKRVGSKPRTEVTLSRALQFFAGGEPIYHCKAGDTLITVMPNGDVYPCRRLPISVGNLNQSSLAEIYAGAPLAELRHPPQQNEDCAHCLYHSLCRGGLRCLAYAMTGDTSRRDPGCWVRPE